MISVTLVIYFHVSGVKPDLNSSSFGYESNTLPNRLLLVIFRIHEILDIL